MIKKRIRLLITGGCGFIGSECVRQAVAAGYAVSVVDALTYAGSLERLKEVGGRFAFYRLDVCDRSGLSRLISRVRPQAALHCAAHTHVDRSIRDAAPFLKTNIEGTRTLLECCRHSSLERFVHVSTDEVYGQIPRGSFREGALLQPNNPYAASKAAADLLINAYMHSYGFRVVIVRPSNTYGPWQHPEKFIPVAVNAALTRTALPLYGNGMNVREWLHVSDCARALLGALSRGRGAEVYNIGSGEARANKTIAREVLRLSGAPFSLIGFVKDRPGHDLRYRLDSSKSARELRWHPLIPLEAGLAHTVFWFGRHQPWVRRMQARLERTNPP